MPYDPERDRELLAVPDQAVLSERLDLGFGRYFGRYFGLHTQGREIEIPPNPVDCLCGDLGKTEQEIK